MNDLIDIIYRVEKFLIEKGVLESPCHCRICDGWNEFKNNTIREINLRGEIKKEEIE